MNNWAFIFLETHRSLWERLNFIRRLGAVGLLKASEAVMWERSWPNHHIAFIVAKKLNLQFILLYLRNMWGEGIGWKRHMGGRGWLKTLEYRHMGEGSKIAQKNRHMIFERFLCQVFTKVFNVTFLISDTKGLVQVPE